MSYDPNNVFAKILRGEFPCRAVYEDDFALAFHDIQPQAPVHVLVIPKAPYVSFVDFSRDAPAELVVGYIRAVGHVAGLLGLPDDGFRLIANIGLNGGQEVPHLHVHLCGGRSLGRMIARDA